MSIHVKRAPTVPLTLYDTKRRSYFKLYIDELCNTIVLHFQFCVIEYIKL